MLLSPKKIVLVFFLVAFTALAVSTRQSRTDCQSTCGTVKIEYPFATSSDCVHEEKFLLRCDEEEQKLFLNNSNLEVLRIALDDGEVEVLVDVISLCNMEGDGGNIILPIEIPGFMFSNKNQLFLLGCNIDTFCIFTMRNGGTTTFTCETQCDSLPPVDKSCSGYNGCCRTSLSNVNSQILINPGNYIGWSSSYSYPCKYVFVVKEGYFVFSEPEDLKNLRNFTRFPVILDWLLSQGTCQQAEDTSFCGENSRCIGTSNCTDYGYSCKCLDGFEGNPYAQHGCKDVDECTVNAHSCGKDHSCKDVDGTFRCKKKKEWTTIILVSVIGCLAFLVGVCCVLLKLKLRQLAKLRERRFESNGGVLLAQRLLESPNQCIKIFTEEEIKQATHETSFLGGGGQGVVFRATLPDNVEVAIKRSRNWDPDQAGQFVNEIILLSQINHPNVVRLLGCCLETPSPLLVYEYVPGGTLHDALFDSSLAWSERLRIAAEIAETLSYLHFSAPVSIVHRDIKPENILLTQTLSVKLCDFGASRPVHTRTGQLTTLVQGTWGYLDPEYLRTRTLTEKSDVYSFGVVVLELVSGEKALSFNPPDGERVLVSHIDAAFKENRLSEVMDQRVVTADNQAVIHKVALLGMSCTRMCGVERPDMRRVAEDLRGLQASGQVVQDEAGPSGTTFEIEEIN
ncbi:hypothetical protein HID58_047598 [Brassica napus]|uniref:(rape) hypothetical protein n=1 Tax=Brassica napus TaxID=3708 RepID=A0A816KC37_BRANA|nr:hypothetical protein HID58_047598 [Brassica napus]CAF1913015.1 unnamed protein product [Brassica napus]